MYRGMAELLQSGSGRSCLKMSPLLAGPGLVYSHSYSSDVLHLLIEGESLDDSRCFR